MVFRTTKKKSLAAAQTYKNGWYQLWKFGKKEMERWEIPPPGSYNPKNLMKGVMPATPQEYRKSHLTEVRLARLVEIAYDGGCSWSNIKTISKCCSFFYHLDKGISSKNFALVRGMIESLDEEGCGTVKVPNVPTKIIQPAALRIAMTREWGGPESGMSLVSFCQGGLANWHWNVIGSRSHCDLDKLKNSHEHHFDLPNGVMSTGFPGGRSKLPLAKKGTREWRGWVLCICPGGKHVSPPQDLRLNKKGNPASPLPRNLCTTCPIVCAEVLLNAQSEFDEKRLYRRWKRKGGFEKNNIGNVVNIARRWLHHQGVMDWSEPFDTNSGRKALALWSHTVGAVYPQVVHLCGDLEVVWRDHYQPSLPPCGQQIREQSTNPLVATAALQLFRSFLGRAPAPPPPPPGLTQDGRALMVIARRLGCLQEVHDIYAND